MEANIDILTRLANKLNRRRALFEKLGSAQIEFHYDKWQLIEEEIEKNGIACNRPRVNQHTRVKIFLSTIQTLISQRQRPTA